MMTGEPAGVVLLEAPRSVWAVVAGCGNVAAGRGARIGEMPWSRSQLTVVRRRTRCRECFLSCGRVVGNSHNEPSAVVQGREGVVPRSRRCLGNGESRRWWRVSGVGGGGGGVCV
jgi:hypothetical protein